MDIVHASLTLHGWRLREVANIVSKAETMGVESIGS